MRHAANWSLAGLGAAVVLLATGTVSECTPPHARLWPLPASCTFGEESATLPTKCTSLAISVHAPSGPGLDAITSSITKLQVALFGSACSPAGSPAEGTLASIDISIASTSDWPPSRPGSLLESFELNSTKEAATLAAPTTAGTLHGLRLLSQLLQPGQAGATLEGVPLSVADEPRYGHRGVMLDTARHFLPLSAIRRTVRAAAASGMNAVHLHLVDAQSFPLQVPSLPRLSGEGAYAAAATYSPEDLASLSAFAAGLGVTVIPEIDVPGHAFSWGVGYPNTTADCPGYEHNINNIPLNPAVRFAFDALQAALRTVATSCGGELVHIGGDEVVLGCWAEDPSVQRLMRENDWTTTTQVLQAFVTQADGIVAALPASPQGRRRRAVHWQDLFDEGVRVAEGSVFQVWRSLDDVGPITDAGFDVVASAQDSGWYLNCGLNPSCPYTSWEAAYGVDIEQGVSPSAKGRVVGGEAVMFGEFANDAALDAQMWPRAAAIAERLWVPRSVNDTTEALPRLTAHACRLHALGVGSAPTGPGYCNDAEFLAFP